MIIIVPIIPQSTIDALKGGNEDGSNTKQYKSRYYD